MTDKLDEIRAVLEELDEAHKRADEFFVNHARQSHSSREPDQATYTMGYSIIQPALEKVNKLAPDYLRLLLPIASAAARLMKASPDYPDYKNKENALLEALAKLKE